MYYEPNPNFSYTGIYLVIISVAGNTRFTVQTGKKNPRLDEDDDDDDAWWWYNRLLKEKDEGSNRQGKARCTRSGGRMTIEDRTEDRGTGHNTQQTRRIYRFPEQCGSSQCTPSKRLLSGVAYYYRSRSQGTTRGRSRRGERASRTDGTLSCLAVG